MQPATTPRGLIRPSRNTAATRSSNHGLNSGTAHGKRQHARVESGNTTHTAIAQSRPLQYNSNDVRHRSSEEPGTHNSYPRRHRRNAGCSRSAGTRQALAALAFAYPLVSRPFVFRHRQLDGAGSGPWVRRPDPRRDARDTADARPLAESTSSRSIARQRPSLYGVAVEFAKPNGIPLTLDVSTVAPTSSRLLQVYARMAGRSRLATTVVATWFRVESYGVIAIDYRHAPESGGLRRSRTCERRSAGGGAFERRRKPLNRIALIGRSAGAQLALVAAYQSGAQLVRAVVIYYGPIDLVEAGDNRSSRSARRPDDSSKRTLAARRDTAPAPRSRIATTYVYPSASFRVPPAARLRFARSHCRAPRFRRRAPRPGCTKRRAVGAARESPGPSTHSMRCPTASAHRCAVITPSASSPVAPVGDLSTDRQKGR